MTPPINKRYKKIFGAIVYWFELCLALLISVLGVWGNLNEAIDRSMSKDTLFFQMTWITDKQAIWYSIGYLIPYIILTFCLIYFGIKN